SFPVSICSTPRERPSGCCHRELGFTPTTGSVPKKAQATGVDAVRSLVLDRVVSGIERLAGLASFCSAPYGPSLGAGPVPRVLGSALSTEVRPARKTTHCG